MLRWCHMNRIGNGGGRILLAMLFLILVTAGCSVQRPSAEIYSRLAAANLMAGTLAKGLAGAVEAGAIEPNSSRAIVAAKTLDAVEISLDAAGEALRGGLPQVADEQIGAAQSQLDTLVPLVEIGKGDAP